MRRNIGSVLDLQNGLLPGTLLSISGCVASTFLVTLTLPGEVGRSGTSEQFQVQDIKDEALSSAHAGPQTAAAETGHGRRILSESPPIRQSSEWS